MSLKSICLTLMLTLSALGGRCMATSTGLDWAYRCDDTNTVVYLAVRTTNFSLLELDLDSANMLLTPAGGSTQLISLNDADGFRTAILTRAVFDAIPDVVRAGLESNDSVITRWIEITIPALTNGAEYSFSANGPRLSTTPSNAWTTTIECGDDTAPVLACTMAQSLLWPPNHQLVNVGFELAELYDDQDPNPTADIYVYSNEELNGSGDGNTEEDAVDVGFDTLKLRAERSGKGDGRVYLIVVVASDASGNTTIGCHSVVVPKSMGKKHRNTVYDIAALAELFCDDEDALTEMGFGLIGSSIEP